jgi:quaternary ammonium compound-resistance protein SugE
MHAAPWLVDDLELSFATGTTPSLKKERVMTWFILVLAGLLEIGWAVGLTYTQGFTRVWPSVATVAALAGSVLLLAVAMKHLPVGTAYAIWVGIGATGTAMLGIFLFGESAGALKLASLALIVAGIAGLKMSG